MNPKIGSEAWYKLHRTNPTNGNFVVVWTVRLTNDSNGLPDEPDLARNYLYSWTICLDLIDGTTAILEGHVAYSSPVTITNYDLNALLQAINCSCPGRVLYSEATRCNDLSTTGQLQSGIWNSSESRDVYTDIEDHRGAPFQD